MVEKYQVWIGLDHTDLFDNFEDALEFLKAENGNEIEKLVWNNEDDYENYEMADDFVTVYRI